MKMGLIEIGCDSVNWIYLAQDRYRWWVCEPVNAGEFLDFCSTLSV
jgi:hypothetical protein